MVPVISVCYFEKCEIINLLKQNGDFRDPVLGGSESPTVVSPAHFSHLPGPGESALHPHLPFPGWEALSIGEKKCGYIASHLTAGGVTHTAPCVYASLHCSEGRLETWHSPPFPNTIVRISWVLFQSSLLLLPQALINLFGASPGTPSNSYKSKESS